MASAGRAGRQGLGETVIAQAPRAQRARAVGHT
jgi:hypothetical protein